MKFALAILIACGSLRKCHAGADDFRPLCCPACNGGGRTPGHLEAIRTAASDMGLHVPEDILKLITAYAPCEDCQGTGQIDSFWVSGDYQYSDHANGRYVRVTQSFVEATNRWCTYEARRPRHHTVNWGFNDYNISSLNTQTKAERRMPQAVREMMEQIPYYRREGDEDDFGSGVIIYFKCATHDKAYLSRGWDSPPVWGRWTACFQESCANEFMTSNLVPIGTPPPFGPQTDRSSHNWNRYGNSHTGIIESESEYRKRREKEAEHAVRAAFQARSSRGVFLEQQRQRRCAEIRREIEELQEELRILNVSRIY